MKMSNGKIKEVSTTNESELLESSEGSRANSNTNGSHQEHLVRESNNTVQNENLSKELSANEIEDVQSKDSEYIPNQIVSFVATSGVNTVSSGPSGQPSACGTGTDQGLMDSKKYRESQALYDSPKEKGSESDPSPKRRKTHSESAMADISKSDNEMQSKVQKPDNKKTENLSPCDSQECEEIIDSKNSDIRLRSTSETYVPSEYGSFQKSGCISTFTKSNVSATEKVTQSTSTPNSKGGISHEDKKEN